MLTLTTDQLITLIREETMDSSEVCQLLGISKQRLSSMAAAGTLTAIKKGIYLRRQVEARATQQVELRKKYRPYDFAK